MINFLPDREVVSPRKLYGLAASDSPHGIQSFEGMDGSTGVDSIV